MSKTILRSNGSSFLSVRNRLLGWGTLMAATYAIYLLAFPLYPMIDQSKIVLEIELILKHGRYWFAPIYILGLGLLALAYWRMLQIVHSYSQEEPGSAKNLRLWVLGIGIVCALLLIGLYPITALDVVLYVVRARLWALYGGSPMMALPMNYPQDPFIHLAGEYVKQPSPYGPVWELVAQIPIRLGILEIGGGVLAMKMISLLSYIGMAVLIGWDARQDSAQYAVSGLTAMTFFALNPLVLMQAIGNGHNDMLMMALITLGLVLWQRGKWVGVAIAFTLAALVKITGFILVPLFGMALLAFSPNWRIRIARGLVVAVIFVGITLLAYRLTGPLPEAFLGTEHAVLGRLGYSPSYAIRIFVSHFLSHKKSMIELPTNLGNILFLLYYIYLLFRIAQGKMTLLQAGFAAYFSQLFLGSTFRIWYPMWLIPFAALNLNSWTYWRTFLFGLTAELSILCYYFVWRWWLNGVDWGKNGLLKGHWDYWLIMTWLTVPWTFGIPFLLPLRRRRRDRQAFDNTLWI